MLRPAVKAVHRPMVLPGRRIQLGAWLYGVSSEIVDDESGSLQRLLQLMDGSRDVLKIWSQLRVTHPGWELGDVRDVIEQLAEAGHVEDMGAPLPAGLTQADAHRYRSVRQYFSWLDPLPRSSPNEVLARIRRARVALVGLGGTGASVAASLVATGIGALHCVDAGRVEPAGLAGQVLCTEADIGRPQADAAVDRLCALNSTVEVTGEQLELRSVADIERLMDGRDVVVLCTDRPAGVQSWTNRAALRTSTPWFLATCTGPTASVGGFLPGVTGCWECAGGPGERRDDAAGQYLFGTGPDAVVAASVAVSGHLCALEVLNHLGGLPGQARGRMFHHNLARWDHHYFVDARRDPHCPACGT
jgi:molybdopterin/thiamine biosynthesis adenylyltransferase